MLQNLKKSCISLNRHLSSFFPSSYCLPVFFISINGNRLLSTLQIFPNEINLSSLKENKKSFFNEIRVASFLKKMLHTSGTPEKKLFFKNEMFNKTSQLNETRNISTISQVEVEHFDRLAEEWWNKDGTFSILHLFNPFRINFLRKHIESSARYSEIITSEEYVKNKICANKHIEKSFYGFNILDVGSGGGILSEGLAELGAMVTGIDPSAKSIYIANKHLHEKSSHLVNNITYKQCEISEMKKLICYEKSENLNYNNIKNNETEQNDSNHLKFDAVICSEVIEHVDNVEAFIQDVFSCVVEGGTVVFSTFNKTLESYLFGVLMAENVLGLIPKGTHNWSKFISPTEIIQVAEKQKSFHAETYGFIYIPFLRTFFHDPFQRVNYLIAFKKY